MATINNVMIMGRTADFEGGPSGRLHLVLGRGIPVDVLRELDAKVDDGLPKEGAVRSTVDSGALFGTIAETEATCVDDTNNIWDIRNDAQNCNAIYIF